MRFPVDIVVPYVNDADPAWRADFDYWKNKELEDKTQSSLNPQAWAPERTRDGDAFKYWFRGVERNCPGVNKVFLVVQRESQLPEWLNRDAPKLRIVYHEDYIPQEYLPTFSTFIIEWGYFLIPDLSEHFIVCNDDMYFLNRIPEDRFFTADGVVKQGNDTRCDGHVSGSQEGPRIVNNNSDFLRAIFPSAKECYHYSHLPDARVKSWDKYIMECYGNTIKERMSRSKFRHPYNLIPSLLFIDTMKYSGTSILTNDVYKKSKYFNLTINTNYDGAKDAEMCCFNDTRNSSYDILKVKDKYLRFLSEKFPNKSSFEK